MYWEAPVTMPAHHCLGGVAILDASRLIRAAPFTECGAGGEERKKC
jgi:hypothetical protein